MKLIDITPESIKKVSNQELLSLHRRVHQLYGSAKSRTTNNLYIRRIIKYHGIIIREMKRRNMLHKSQIKFKLPGDL